MAQAKEYRKFYHSNCKVLPASPGEELTKQNHQSRPPQVYRFSSH